MGKDVLFLISFPCYLPLTDTGSWARRTSERGKSFGCITLGVCIELMYLKHQIVSLL